MKTISSVKISQIFVSFLKDTDGKDVIDTRGEVQFLDDLGNIFSTKTVSIPLTDAQKTTVTNFKNSLETKAKEIEEI